jgi:hypothetical protein
MQPPGLFGARFGGRPQSILPSARTAPGAVQMSRPGTAQNPESRLLLVFRFVFVVWFGMEFWQLYGPVQRRITELQDALIKGLEGGRR